MLLSEIKLNIKTDTKPRSFTPNVKNASVLGSGVQTIAYAHKKYPNAVLKVSGVLGKNSAAVQFLRVCVNHQDNPFFPKIYSYKLVPAKEMSEDDRDYLEDEGADLMIDSPYYLISVVERLDKVYAPGVVSALAAMNIDANEFEDAYEFEDDRVLNRRRRKLVYDKCNNTQFKQALRLLDPLMNTYIPDLHSDNFMRRGSQLVINDPII